MATAKKKVWILDGGSLVIDRSQVLWHIDAERRSGSRSTAC